MVKDIPKERILCAEDVGKFLSINKNINALHADSQQKKQENVIIYNFFKVFGFIFFILDVGWGTKVRGRRGQGTGRMSYLKDLPRRAKNQFREGTTPKARTRKVK